MPTTAAAPAAFAAAASCASASLKARRQVFSSLGGACLWLLPPTSPLPSTCTSPTASAPCADALPKRTTMPVVAARAADLPSATATGWADASLRAQAGPPPANKAAAASNTEAGHGKRHVMGRAFEEVIDWT